MTDFARFKEDRLNPNVILLEGKLSAYEGEYSAWSVTDFNGSVIYLSEMIEEISGWKGKIMTFQWHICSEPMLFHELEEHLAETLLGKTKAEFQHRYSDLTGYLWTDEKVDVGGHDFLEMIRTQMLPKGPTYIALRIEKQSDR